MVFAEFLEEESKKNTDVKALSKDEASVTAKKAKDKPLNLNIGVPKDEPMLLLTPKISVIGVGGAGGNAINTMISSDLKGARFLVANTDAQALTMSYADCRIQLGLETTRGLGSGMNPAVGKAAAEEAIDKVVEEIKDSNMLFIAVGMGGGTGTGAAPVIAKAAKELGILTVGVVTKPFNFEGKRRMDIALKGIDELSKYVDTIIVIPNQNLFRIATEKTSFADAFKMADNVLYSGVRNITDLIMVPGLINLDFADVSTVIQEMGRAMMGIGEAEGDNRALLSAEAAITNQLLDDNSMKGAKGILINITGGIDLSLVEVDAAAERIKSEVDPDANVIIGACLDPALEGKMRVSVVATGISGNKKTGDDAEDANGDIFSSKLANFGRDSKVSSFASQILANTSSAKRPSLSSFFTDEHVKEKSLSPDVPNTMEEKTFASENKFHKAESDPEDNPPVVINTLDDEDNSNPPVITGSGNNFSIGAEPLMTIYDDERDFSDTGIIASDMMDLEEKPDAFKKSYSNLFKKVTRFTLGRKSKLETEASVDLSLKTTDDKLGSALPKISSESKIELGSAGEPSSKHEDLDIPAFLRRR